MSTSSGVESHNAIIIALWYNITTRRHPTGGSCADLYKSMPANDLD